MAAGADTPAPLRFLKSDSARKIVALALWIVTAVGAGALFCGSVRPDDNGERAMSRIEKERDHGARGLQALCDDKLLMAEHEFTKSGDDTRLAEVFIRQGRWEEAEPLVQGRECGRAKLMLALIHQHRCEFGEYRRRLVEASNLGNEPADVILAHMEADAGG